jgi:hypothetical protein
MKKAFVILAILASSKFVNAQENPKQKEVGLAFRSFDNFGLTFKVGSDKSLWRFNTLAINGGTYEKTGDSLNSDSKSFGVNLRFGKEFRKVIYENLELRYGADLFFQYTNSRNNEDDLSVDDYDRLSEQTCYEPGINLVFGLNYVLKNNLVFGVELLPGFSYFTGKSVEKNYYSDGKKIESDISGIHYGLSNSSALLTLAYRF